MGAYFSFVIGNRIFVSGESVDPSNVIAKSGAKRPKVVACGASILDFESITSEDLKNDGGSYPGRVVQRCGGISRNHCEAIGRLTTAADAASGDADSVGRSNDVILLSAVGCDAHGEFLMGATGKHVDVSRVRRHATTPTAVHMSMNQKGNIIYGIACIQQIMDEITPEYIAANEDVLSTADYIICDANLPVRSLSKVLEIAKFHGRKVWFDPTELSIAANFLDVPNVVTISALSPNVHEFLIILTRLGVETDPSCIVSPFTLLAFIHTLPPVLPHLELLLVTMAQQGSLLITKELVAEKYMVSECAWGKIHVIPPPMATQIVSVSGAGDTMNSSLLFSLLHSRSLEESIDFALRAVALTLRSTNAVAEELSDMKIA